LYKVTFKLHDTDASKHSVGSGNNVHTIRQDGK